MKAHIRMRIEDLDLSDHLPRSGVGHGQHPSMRDGIELKAQGQIFRQSSRQGTRHRIGGLRHLNGQVRLQGAPSRQILRSV